jgi:hypothetical protein
MVELNLKYYQKHHLLFYCVFYVLEMLTVGINQLKEFNLIILITMVITHVLLNLLILHQIFNIQIFILLQQLLVLILFQMLIVNIKQVIKF